MRRAAQTTNCDPATRRPGSRAIFALALVVALVTVGTLALSTLAAPPAAAQTGGEDGTEPTMTKQERKQAEKDARIREYLRKKEERRILREQRKADAAAAAQRSTATARTEQVATVASPRPATKKSKQKPERRSAGSRGRSSLPRGLAQAQGNVRASSLGDDATVQSYLELIDQQGASPYQLAAFGNFIAQSGLVDDALAYYDVALKLERDDPTLWINMGTLQRQHGDANAASSAFGRALRLDPNNAVAYYNLGAVYDEAGRYDDAIEAYRTALTLDPALGDPASNPQAANNDRLLAVKLMLYNEQSGSLGLPLQAVDANRNGP